VRGPRPRLALRIYLAGLAQIGAVLLGFTLIIELGRMHDRQKGIDARAAVEEVAAKLGDAEALAAELDRVEKEFDATIVIYDEEGHVLATSRHEDDAPLDSVPLPDPLPPPHDALPHMRGLPGPPPREAHLHFPNPLRPLLPRGPRPRLGGPFPPHEPPIPAFMIPVRLPDGRMGRALYTSKSPLRPPANGFAIVALVLVVVGVSSLLTARSIARPLARLSKAARAFGKGQLGARVDLTRSDEIGEVAAAFDEMAGRITSLLRAEKELLANVSHELRTPLSRIRVALDLAAEGDAEMAREALGEIAEDLAELERLISDVLTASRLDLGDLAEGSAASGIPPLRLERVDVRELLERAAARFRSAHPGRPLVVELATELPVIDGDPVLLRRVIDNLLENAHKYTSRAEESVELHAAVVTDELSIEVRDRGIGISPDDLPHVFRPFFRADRSRTRATGGLGLGLALARRIVEAHHGTIEMESRVGEGTRAHIHLPIAPAHADAQR